MNVYESNTRNVNYPWDYTKGYTVSIKWKVKKIRKMQWNETTWKKETNTKINVNIVHNKCRNFNAKFVNNGNTVVLQVFELNGIRDGCISEKALWRIAGQKLFIVDISQCRAYVIMGSRKHSSISPIPI